MLCHTEEVRKVSFEPRVAVHILPGRGQNIACKLCAYLLKKVMRKQCFLSGVTPYHVPKDFENSLLSIQRRDRVACTEA